MKTDSPGERRESQGWCQEILRVMNWNLLIRDWKIQPELTLFRSTLEEGQAGGSVDRDAVFLCLQLGTLDVEKALASCLGQKGIDCKQTLSWARSWTHVIKKSGWNAAGDQGWKGALWQDPICTPKHRNGHRASLRCSSGTWNLHLKPAKNLDPAGICTDALRIWP